MDPELLGKHFRAIGAKVKFRPNDPGTPKRPGPPPTSFSIDIRRDARGEYFDIARGGTAPDLEVLQVRPHERHLLLYSRDGQRFLCGHDERHWFVAAVPRAVSTVAAAKQALLPPAVWEQVKDLPPGEVDNRRNAVFRRQGEWFFLPTTRDIPPALILRHEPLQRTARSKPHVCQELYREGGEVVYLVRGKEYSEREYAREKQRDPGFDRGLARRMVRNPNVYARGYVRHEDHATIRLTGWHRVFINAELTAGTSVTFLD